MQPLLEMIFSLSLAGTLLGLFLMLLTRIFGKKLPPAFTYYAWLIVLLRFLLPVPGQLSGDALSARAEWLFSPAVYESETSAATPSSVIIEPVISLSELQDREIRVRPHSVNNPGLTSAFQPILVYSRPSSTSPAESEAAEPEETRSGLRLPGIWFGLWLSGLLLSASVTYGGYIRFCRLLRRTLKPPKSEDLAVLHRLQPASAPALCRSRAVGTPMLLGLIHPVIVLPDRDYTGGMLESILLHELTHYRRGDMLYKWFSVLVLLLHWFNPLTLLFRRELDRTCELNCDAAVLRGLNREEKQRYGELLISMAADRSFPGSVVAMSFTTEKRNLKERLIQIMTYRTYGKASLALILALILLLTGCGMALGPSQTASVTTSEPTEAVSASTPEPAPLTAAIGVSDTQDLALSADLPETVIDVSSVDELLAAIGPDRLIRLADGEYNLTKASTYGQPVQNDYWYWESDYDGSQLKLFGIRNLFLQGSSFAHCSIVTEPRYANVLSFSGCENLNLTGLRVGHTVEQGYCSGGVLSFDSCSQIAVNFCDLYGCGALGISATNCRDLIAVGTTIRDCTYGGIEAYSCKNIRFLDGGIIDCGISKDPEYADGWTGFNLLHADTCTGFAVVNSEIRGNVVQTLFNSSSSIGCFLLGCEVRDNTIGVQERYPDENGNMVSYAFGAMFDIRGKALVLSHTSFAGNRLNVPFFGEEESAYGEMRPAVNSVVDLYGNSLSQSEIEGMARGTFPEDDLDSLLPADPGADHSTAEDQPSGAGLIREVHVTTADEFLDAIHNNTIIHVDTPLLDFSTASNYGGYGGDHYYWVDNFDGPGLVITGVSGLHIMGKGKGQTTLQATPRYAEVLYFDSCRDISVSDLTAGHLKEAPGSCSGDVFELIYCENVILSNCGLFGCGVNGIVATQCSGFNVNDTEIYECSWTGAQLYTCTGFNFERCSVHDCGSNTIHLSDSSRVLWDERTLMNGENPV